MRRKFLKILAICLSILMVIDSALYIFFDFECIDALLKLIGTKSLISIIFRWIIIGVALAACIFVIKFNKTDGYSIKNPDPRKYK